MTAVNENLNRQTLSSTNNQPKTQTNDSELFGLSNGLLNTDDCNRQSISTVNQNQFDNQQIFQTTNHLNNSNSLTNDQSNTPNLTNLTNVSVDAMQNNFLSPLDNVTNKKCDLNNNTISDLMNETTNRSMNGLNDTLDDNQLCLINQMNSSNINTISNSMTENDNMNDVHQLNRMHQSTSQQSDDYANRNLICKTNSLITNNNHDDNYQSFIDSNAHNFHPLNHLNHLNHHLDRSLNVNTLKLNVSGRRGRPPKKDSKSRSRQSRGKRQFSDIYLFKKDLKQ